MINPKEWMHTLTEKAVETFGKRLVFTGLQGSYARGEATEDSDIDAVIVLDTVSLDDLKLYKSIVQTMPESEKACGFIGGRQELAGWPAHDLLQFTKETVPYYGTLNGLLPEISREAVVLGVLSGAASLYHSACHAYLHAEAQDHDKLLKALYKGASFIAQMVCYLESGIYYFRKDDLLEALDGDARYILHTYRQWPVSPKGEELYDTLIRWSGKILRKQTPRFFN